MQKKAKEEPKIVEANTDQEESDIDVKNKENDRIYGENLVLKEEKSNILSKLLILQNTALFNVLSSFAKYKSAMLRGS